MTVTTTDITTIEPLTHQEAMRRQAHELQRTVALLRSLDGQAWAAATDCPAWDIRAMYQHVLGACEAGASLRENIRQLRRARAHRSQHGGPLEAALSAVQVRDRACLSPAQITEQLAAIAPATIRGRTRIPDDGVVTAQSVRNRFPGLVTRVIRDTVMAQVEIQAGPHRFVSLLSREAADELGLEPGVLAVAAVKSQPTVLAEVTPDMPAYASEVFGPVAPMLKFATPDEAAALAADSEYGLSLGILTGDAMRGLDLARRIPTGIVHINEQTVDDEPNVPFGGILASGTSARFGGTANLDAFTETRWVTMRGDIAAYPF